LPPEPADPRLLPPLEPPMPPLLLLAGPLPPAEFPPMEAPDDASPGAAPERPAPADLPAALLEPGFPTAPAMALPEEVTLLPVVEPEIAGEPAADRADVPTATELVPEPKRRSRNDAPGTPVDPVVSALTSWFIARRACGRMAHRQTSWPWTMRRRQLPYMDALATAGWHCWPDLGIWAWAEADVARNKVIADKARACERFMVHLTREY
jgi:hypothetical protein